MGYLEYKAKVFIFKNIEVIEDFSCIGDKAWEIAL